MAPASFEWCCAHLWAVRYSRIPHHFEAGQQFDVAGIEATGLIDTHRFVARCESWPRLGQIVTRRMLVAESTLFRRFRGVDRRSIAGPNVKGRHLIRGDKLQS